MNFEYKNQMSADEKRDGVLDFDQERVAKQERNMIERLGKGAKKVGRAFLLASALAVGGSYGSEQQALAMEKPAVADTEKSISPEREALYLVKHLAGIRVNPNDRFSVEIGERKARTLITNFAARMERRRLNIADGATVHLDKSNMRTALEMIVEALNTTSDKELGNGDGSVDANEKARLFKEISGKPGFDVFKQMVRENKIGS